MLGRTTMAESQTAEQVLEHQKEVLGEEFGLQFYALHNDLVWLYTRWFQFKQLFSTNEKRIELMNQTAPSFFRMLQLTLWENIILNIARLVDSRKSVGKENLTLQWLPSHLTVPIKQSELQTLVNAAIEAASFAKDWRHRNIAHRDLSLAMKRPVEPLESVNTVKVERALKAIQDVLSWVHKEYFDTQFAYEFANLSGGAEVLLSHLREGLEARKQRFDRIESGIATQADYDLRGAP